MHAQKIKIKEVLNSNSKICIHSMNTTANKGFFHRYASKFCISLSMAFYSYVLKLDYIFTPAILLINRYNYKTILFICTIIMIILILIYYTVKFSQF
jgi:hypothetical protein